MGRRRLLGLGIVALSPLYAGCLDRIRRVEENETPDKTTTSADSLELQVWNERSDDIAITVSITASDGTYEFSTEGELEAGTRKAYPDAIPEAGKYRIEVDASGQTAERNHEFVRGKSLDVVVEESEIRFLEAVS